MTEPRHQIHYTELSPAPADSPLAVEYELFRREIGRWLAEGRGGQCVLIKGEEVIGFYPTFRQAADEGYRRFPRQPFMAQPVREYEPVIRMISPIRVLLDPATGRPHAAIDPARVV
ncbi:MAG: hypothetical protein ACRC33_30650 [Gemmataceae bacterium]